MDLRRARNPLAAVGLAIVATAGVLFVTYGPLFDPPPQAAVAGYLDATASADESAALSTWQLWDCCQPRPDLEARRIELTREMAALGVGREHRIIVTQWWTTCCMPTVTDDPKRAGRALILVNATDAVNAEHELVFDVQVQHGPLWDPLGSDIGRQWIVREVYRYGERPLLGGPPDFERLPDR